MCFIHEYQDLIAGVLALIAAGITLLFTMKGESRTLTRQSDAARAVMPLALAGLAEWTEHIARELQNTLATTRFNIAEDESEYLKRGDYPSVPSELVQEFRTIIAATKDELVRRRLSMALANVQVLQSRLSGMSDPQLVVTSDNLNTHLVKAATIHAEVESLFDYARFRDYRVQPITWGEVRKTLSIWRCIGPGFDSLAEMVQRLESSGAMPEDPKF